MLREVSRSRYTEPSQVDDCGRSDDQPFALNVAVSGEQAVQDWFTSARQVWDQETLDDQLEFSIPF